MHKKDDLAYVGHMLDTAREAAEILGNRSRTEYDADRPLRLAIIHLIQVIGESARRVSDDFCQEHPEIPWADIVGMRHRIVHDYIDVDESIVWDTAQDSLPSLIELLAKIVPPES